ncbi:hypothetical protein F2P81_023765 [Scophthalmus maximus]|uniref:Uncharacterized protein n=1 Tax=Scophthalmus maximus TaxID=52904 RepID=A0A6A4RSI6_SCOMX|nr:hypothetical protein F2P81_023765 [Scophthalmus maximus]
MLRKASSESNVTKKQMDKVGKYLVKTRSGYGEPDIPAAALYPQSTTQKNLLRANCRVNKNKQKKYFNRRLSKFILADQQPKVHQSKEQLSNPERAGKRTDGRMMTVPDGAVPINVPLKRRDEKPGSTHGRNASRDDSDRNNRSTFHKRQTSKRREREGSGPPRETEMMRME